MSQYIALVPAAGHGSRFGSATPKQYLLLDGQPLLAHTLDVLCACAAISRVVVVISPGDEWFDSYRWPQAVEVLRVGGASRAQSVANGLAALAADEDDWVLVHDAARCCLSAAALQRLIDTLQDDAVGGLLAQPVADTVKQGSVHGRVAATVPRDGLWLAQTPQMFRAGLLAEALADAANPAITDEASAIELLGHAPQLVVGEAQNFKVTWPQDLALAAAILHSRKG